jgi:hypothetical protein
MKCLAGLPLLLPLAGGARVCDVEVEIKRPDGAPPSSLRTDC